MCNISVIRHSYKVRDVLKQYSVYELIEATNLQPTNGQNLTKLNISTNEIPLTEVIRIELFRFCSKGTGFDHYLRLRNLNNWSKCEKVTGLFKTENKNIFWGNRIYKGQKHFIVFVFNDSRDIVTIDYYTNYHPKNNIELQACLNRYIQL